MGLLRLTGASPLDGRQQQGRAPENLPWVSHPRSLRVRRHPDPLVLLRRAGAPPQASPLPQNHAVARGRSTDGMQVRRSIVLNSTRKLHCSVRPFGTRGEHEACMYPGFSRLHRLPCSFLLDNAALCNALFALSGEIPGVCNHGCAQCAAILGLQRTSRRDFRVRARHGFMMRAAIHSHNSRFSADAIGNRL